MTTAKTFYEQGDLDAAIAVLSEELRNKPGDSAKRAFLAELLCFNNDLERADKQVSMLGSLNPGAMLTAGTWRQLIRAAQARNDVYQKGAAPEVVDSPTPTIQQQLSILLSLREGNIAAAAEKAVALEGSRKPWQPVINGIPTDDVRDLDDTSAGILEVLASNGKYFWIDVQQIRELQIAKPERPLDLLWRKATMILHSGSEGDVFIPTLYSMPAVDADTRVGRKTEWVEQGGIVRGVGQRMWLVGDEALSLGDIQTVNAEQTVEAVAGA
ncbi:MAG: SciE type virulence protein [Gammaproteobacteria bacterium]|nr:SciE type virulence protein [Gammaproteobacteria bacterium]